MGTVISTSAAAKISAFFKVASFTAITGITTESKTGSVLIPANTIIDTGAGIEITARAIKTGVAGTLTARIYANTTDDLSGAVLLGTFVGSSTDIFVQLERTLFIGKLGTKVFSPSVAAFSSDDTRFTAAEVNQSINWANPQYIILSIQNSAAGDSSVGSGIMVKTINR
jgi:hypothetical protein